MCLAVNVENCTIVPCCCTGNGRSVRKWWEVFCTHTTEKELQHIARQIMAIYDDKPKPILTSREDEENRGSASEKQPIVAETSNDQSSVSKTPT